MTNVAKELRRIADAIDGPAQCAEAMRLRDIARTLERCASDARERVRSFNQFFALSDVEQAQMLGHNCGDELWLAHTLAGVEVLGVTTTRWEAA